MHSVAAQCVLSGYVCMRACMRASACMCVCVCVCVCMRACVLCVCAGACMGVLSMYSSFCLCLVCRGSTVSGRNSR